MNILTMIQRINSEGFTPEINSKFSKDELYILATILDELKESGRSSTLDGLWERDFERTPVSIDEFLDDEYYLGKLGSSVYPAWREDLRYVLSPQRNIGEWILHGSIGCLAGDTRIPLLDGTAPTIKELSETHAGSTFNVRTVDLVGARFTVGIGSYPRRTGSDQPTYKVTFDNGCSVTATPDHRFLMYDLRYKCVCDLHSGDTMCPPAPARDPIKVTSVAYAGSQDVYDIEVEGTHNFAVSAGVVVHNSGKTFVAVIAIMYKMYYLTCLADPAKFYGLATGSPIIFGLFNVYRYLAAATSYKYLTTWLRDMSPYFASLRGPSAKGKYLSENQVLKLPKNISVALGASSIHALGLNIYGGLPLAGDTKIALLNGRDEEIKDLVGREFLVYGYDNEQVVPASATAFLSKTARLYEVMLDNKEVVRCCAEHLWMLHEESYIRTDELRAGMPLMSFHRRLNEGGFVEVRSRGRWVPVSPVPRQSKDDFKRFCVTTRRVLSITLSSTVEPVYCLTVPRTHNYAISAGVFHHNCDEAEFGRIKSMTNEDRSQVADLYHNVRMRMDSRFLQRGGSNPGLLTLVSSARDTDNFLVEHILKKEDDPNTYVSSYALYEIKAETYKDSPRFKVIVGDKLNTSYIADDAPDKDPREGATVLDVPVEFLEAFRYDIDTAIRDIAGVETYGKSLLLPRRDLLLACFDAATPRRHPFTRESVTLGLDDDTYIEDYFDQDEIIDLFDKTNRLYRPRFYPYADRFIHVDLAKSRDAAGLAMSCISETKHITRISQDGLTTNARDYVFFVDFMLRIKAATGSEIDFSKIRKFIFFLRDTCKFRLKCISYDSWQSTDSLQTFKKERNLDAKELSVDRKPGPYRTLRSIIMERRLDAYYYDPFFEEFTQLEDHSNGGRHKPLIDHPPNGAKDVSDSVAGSINNALAYKGLVIGTDGRDSHRRVQAYADVATGRGQKKVVIRNERSATSPLEKLFS